MCRRDGKTKHFNKMTGWLEIKSYGLYKLLKLTEVPSWPSPIQLNIFWQVSFVRLFSFCIFVEITSRSQIDRPFNWPTFIFYFPATQLEHDTAVTLTWKEEKCRLRLAWGALYIYIHNGRGGGRGWWLALSSQIWARMADNNNVISAEVEDHPLTPDNR